MSFFKIFQPEHMLNLCLNFDEPLLTYVCKRYAYKKDSFSKNGVFNYLNELVVLSKRNTI